MHKFIFTLCFCLFSFSVFAADLDEMEVEAETGMQQNLQTQCTQERLDACLAVCQKTNNPNCSDLCEENAKNECRQAGE